MKLGERNVMLLFLVLSAGATLLSLGFQHREARLFPLIVGAVTTVLIVGYFVIVNVPALRQRLAPFIEDDIFMKIAAAADALPEEEAEEASEVAHRQYGGDGERGARERILFAYLGGFVFLGWLVGLTVATPVFLFAAMVGYARADWRQAAIVTIATAAFIHLVFVMILRLPPHLGLLGGLL